MKVVIFAGGLGTRLAEETEVRPKPMVEIGGKPIIWHIMKIYSSFGFNEFIVCLGYKGFFIKEYFMQYYLHNSDITIELESNKVNVHYTNAESFTVTLVETGLNTKTAGRLKKIQRYLGDEDFMLTYGDGVADINIETLLKFHQSHNKIATVTAVQPEGRFGSMEIEHNGIVDHFKEKPKGDNKWINGGFFVLKPEVFNYLNDANIDDIMWEDAPMQKLANDKQLVAYKHTGFWKPMDALRDKLELEGSMAIGERKMENVVMQLQQYYKNKKILVTGHTGFKGAWLIAVLHTLNSKIKGYSLAPEYEKGLYEIMQPSINMQSIIADIRDKTRLQKEIESFQPDYIFHLAAQPLVRRSYEIPAETFDVNVVGTANVLEAAINLKKKCTVIIITTDKVYENKEDNSILYKEEDTLGGFDPYSASKACAELVISSFRNSFFNIKNYSTHQKAIASVRAGNVIGGGDWNKDRIIPDIVRSLQNNKTIEVRNPNAVRPWQHVLEPLSGYLLLGAMLNDEPQKFSKPYNFGPLPNDHLSVKELVESAIKILGNGEWKDISNTNEPHEAGLLKLGISRAQKELHWQPKLNAQQAIEYTIEWYKHSTETQAAFTFQQINNYFTL